MRGDLLAKRSTDAMAFLRQGAGAVSVTMLQGWGSSRARRIRQRPPKLRWMIAHAIGHKLLHPGRRLRMHEHALFGGRVERASGEFAGALLMDWREAPDHDRVHRRTLPRTRRLRGMVRLHGLCHRMTGSAEVCSLLTPQPPTDLSLPALSFSISLFGAGAS